MSMSLAHGDETLESSEQEAASVYGLWAMRLCFRTYGSAGRLP